jgi:hypothetical protein
MGFSLSHQSKTNLLDIVGHHFADTLIDEIKAGKKLQGIGDNWDLRINVHEMQLGNQNIDLHYFASCMMVERVPCKDLSAIAPRKDVLSLPNSSFLLNNSESIELRENFKVLVGRVLVENVTHLSFMKSIIPTHIPHDYERETALKSTIVPLSMQLKDEKKYDDVVDILDYYEQELENIYAKAGVIQKPAETKEGQKPTSIEGLTSAADQPGAHSNKADDNDHMKAIAVPFGGDQMTRVRFAGAKDLRSGAHTAKERLDHCSPFFSAPFHTKMAFVQVQYRSYFVVNYGCKSNHKVHHVI